MPKNRSDHSNRPATRDHLQKKKPLERLVPIILDDEAINELAAADGRLRAAQATYDQWFAAARDAQLKVIATLPLAEKKAFLDELPDPPGASDRLAAVTAAKEAFETAEEAVREATFTVRFRSIGRKKYEALVDAHPPTDQDNIESMAENGQPAPYNGDTFGPALVAASAVEPEITLEEARGFWDDWNPSEVIDLFTGALICNTFRRSVSLGNG